MSRRAHGLWVGLSVLASVLLRLGALEQEGVGDVSSYRAVPTAAWDEVQLPRTQRDRIASLLLDPKAAVPAEEEFVLLVLVPRELAVQPGDTDHRVVDRDQVTRLPRPWKSRAACAIEIGRSVITLSSRRTSSRATFEIRDVERPYYSPRSRVMSTRCTNSLVRRGGRPPICRTWRWGELVTWLEEGSDLHHGHSMATEPTLKRKGCVDQGMRER
jgi:hypothetical protein